MGASYAYAVGNLRAKEVALLQKQDMEQLLAAGDVTRMLAMLRDKGYGDPAISAVDMDGLLRAEVRKTWDYLRSVTPDFSLYDAFLIRNDLHNCKALIKGVLGQKEVSALLSEPSLVSPAVMEEAVRERNFSLLPPFLASAAERAYSVLAHTTDAQLSDAILDRAGMERMLICAKQSRVSLLIDLMNTLVFYTNIKIALRAARAEKPRAFLEEALCPCGNSDTDRLVLAALEGESAVLEWMDICDRYHSREAAEQYRSSPSAFERFVDNLLMSFARIGRTVTLGPEPLLGYLMAKESEIRDLNILASGLRAGQPEQDIRKRVRDLYV